MANSLNIKWLNLERVLNEFADAVIERARQNLDENNTNASHNLYDTMEKIVNIPDEEGFYTVSISLADYWRYVEEGTGPQHIPDARDAYWPKLEPLKNWVSIKPGVPKDPAFAYAVRGAIRFGTKDHPPGTKPHPFFKKAVDEVLAFYDPLIEKAIEDDIYDFIDETVIKEMERTLGGK